MESRTEVAGRVDWAHNLKEMSGRKINTKEDKRNQEKARVFIGEVGCVLMGGEVS